MNLKRFVVSVVLGILAALFFGGIIMFIGWYTGRI